MHDEERIRQRAYEIWEREGRPEGGHERHWQQAKDELLIEDGESLSVAGEEDPEPSLLPLPGTPFGASKP